MKKFPMLSVLIIAVAVFTSCSKEGPEGPAGATGATGSQGSPGPTGPAGETGTANVIYSEWFTPSAYTSSTLFGITNMDYNKAAPGITQDILNTGVVLTFGKLTGYSSSIWPTEQVSKLPISLTYIQGSTQTDTWSAYETVGNLRINFVNNVNYYTSISTAHSFRYVIIPGGTVGTRVAAPDFNNYEAVCAFYKIPN
jgi:hypothetical protein